MDLARELEEASAVLDGLVERREFAAAQAAAERIGELVRTGVRGLPAAEAGEWIRQASRRIEGARRRICAARARLAVRLRRLEQMAPYHCMTRTAVHTWSVDG